MTESLGKTVRERRRQLRLTQQDVSDLSGVSVRFLHDLEHDTPSVRMDVVLAATADLTDAIDAGVLPFGAGDIAKTVKQLADRRRLLAA